MAGEEPVILPVGTEVSAKYRGAFCEAKVKKIVKCVKCKVTITEPRSQIVVLDEDVKGSLKTGAKVEVKHPETGQYVEASFNKLTDCSMYTVVFDDGDENTLRRTQLCLKGEKHFVKSETLDQLPLTHPEHFGTPVMKSYKGSKRRRPGGGAAVSDSESESEASECSSPRKRIFKGRSQDMIGRVLCMEIDDRKKTTWVPVLTIIPSSSEGEGKLRDQLFVKSFKDSRTHFVARKDTKEFTRDMAIKNEDKTLKPAMEKALAYYDSRDLPSNWDREELLGLDSEEEDESDSSDDEPSEEKDHFVAQLYKFMDDRDTPINKAPAIGARDLNLYRLFKLVRNLGGYNKVTNLMKWKMVYSKMNLPASSNAYNQIKTAYKKYLHAYEDFYRKLGSTMGNRPGRTRHSSGRSLLSFREREGGQPKSPRAEKRKEEKPQPIEEDKDEDKKTDDKKDEDNKTKGKESEKKETETKGKKTEDRKSGIKEETDVDVDSPRKRRSRTGGEKKVEEKTKEEEKVNKRVTREDAAKMKDDSKVKEEERSRRSMSKKVEDSEEKEDATQKRRSVPTRKKAGKSEEKEDPKKKSQEEAISDGGPDDDSDDGDDEEEEPQPPPKEETRKDFRRKELSLGTKLKVRYGRGRNQKIYEAKVVEAEQEAGSTHYLVHYAGWNNRYDEWVQRDRIVAVVSEGTDTDKKIITAKKLISPKSGTMKKVKRPPGGGPSPSPSSSSTKPEVKPVKNKTPTPAQSGSKARPTRSSGPDLPSPVLPTRRSRRGSGVGDNASDLTSHLSDSESDEDESVTDEKKVDTDDTDSIRTRSEKPAVDTKSRSQPKTPSKSSTAKKEKETIVSDFESDVSEPKEVKPKGKGTPKGKLDVKPEPSPAGTEKSDEEDTMQVDSPKKPGKSTPTRSTKAITSKQEEPVPSPQIEPVLPEEPMELDEKPENKASDLLAKDEDAQSEDDILKDLKVNHHIDMGDILVYPDSDMSIAPPKLKSSKEATRGKRRKSTDSADEVSRQDSLDTVAYGYDIQDAVQNILDQLDEGDDDSDDLPFLTQTKEQKGLFHVAEEKKEEVKTEKVKKEKKEKVKEKGEKPKPKTPKKAEKLAAADEAKHESDTEKEKKHDGDKKKKAKKKKVKKKVESKESEKESDVASVPVMTEKDLKPVVAKAELDLVLDSVMGPPSVTEEITSPPQLAAVTPNKEKEDLSKSDSAGPEMSPLPPKLQAERLDTHDMGEKAEEELQPAALMAILPPEVPELTTATTQLSPIITTTTTTATTITTQPPPKLQPPSQPQPLPSETPSSPPQAPASSTSSSSTPAAAAEPAPPEKIEPEVVTEPVQQPCTSSAIVPDMPSATSAPPVTTAEVKPPTAVATPTVPATVAVSPAHPAPATLFDNTPPETPEGSPEAPPASDVTKSPPHAQDSSTGPARASSPPPCALPPAATLHPPPAAAERPPTETAEPPVVLPPGGESPNACDTSTISNGSEGSSGNMPSSEDSTEGSAVMTHTTTSKRKLTEDNQQPAKKRKRGSKRGANADKGKTTPKHTMSDSDEAPESGSASPKASESQPMTPVKSTPSKSSKAVMPHQSPAAASGSSGTSPGRGDEPRPPRASKYNFNLEEGNYLEGDQRIFFIMEKLQEIRKIYMSLKAEVACIDRRRKRAKRREKEGTALALASLANS